MISNSNASSYNAHKVKWPDSRASMNNMWRCVRVPTVTARTLVLLPHVLAVHTQDAMRVIGTGLVRTSKARAHLEAARIDTVGFGDPHGATRRRANTSEMTTATMPHLRRLISPCCVSNGPSSTVPNSRKLPRTSSRSSANTSTRATRRMKTYASRPSVSDYNKRTGTETESVNGSLDTKRIARIGKQNVNACFSCGHNPRLHSPFSARTCRPPQGPYSLTMRVRTPRRTTTRWLRLSATPR